MSETTKIEQGEGHLQMLVFSYALINQLKAGGQNYQSHVETFACMCDFFATAYAKELPEIYKNTERQLFDSKAAMDVFKCVKTLVEVSSLLGKVTAKGGF